mmetsp:Transcript_5608/g.5806  ORF Transcript_5608/g.5806 Transcript_5608/m.5806 type:complete len:421 (+) Transcript_5608:130-1392(+)|eukprot:CAMPEP_0182444128 /NCGR_PEP_ID=MMETSP1172-20130603/2675_1 /TAXON_ID=708627 /ORGANISM="Timspurckia oligopyrenoides, Strain CCMP3278" /LENGTH=420 /DNA_ID=CAMNT_0024639617 /DNA_START=144 /DNA_END=1406 /DNA_ORIENTATION=+
MEEGVEFYTGREVLQYASGNERSSCVCGKIGVGSTVGAGRYLILETVGSGSHAEVSTATDLYSAEVDKVVALKRIPNPWRNPEYAKNVMREITLMKCLQSDYLLPVIDVFVECVDKEKVELFVVTEPMASTVRHVVRSDMDLSIQHIKRFMLQLFLGLRVLHVNNVVHGDIKPSNLLINADSSLKIGDFGNARVLQGGRKAGFQADSVVSRWYQPPEVCLKGHCGTKVDMWSAGCVLAELLLRKPLYTGASTNQQVESIVSSLGSSACSYVDHLEDPSAIRFLSSLPDYRAKPFSELKEFKDIDREAVDLLEHLLVFNPEKRYSAEEALKHPFFSDVFKTEMLEKVVVTDIEDDTISDLQSCCTSSSPSFALLAEIQSTTELCDSSERFARTPSLRMSAMQKYEKQINSPISVISQYTSL